MASSSLSRPGEHEIRQWMEALLPELYRSMISARCRRAEFHLSGDTLLFLTSEYFVGWRDEPSRLVYVPSRFGIHLPGIIHDLIRDDAFVYAWDDAGRVDPRVSWLDLDRYDVGQWVRAQLDLRIDEILATLGNLIHTAHERGECPNFDAVITGLTDWSFHCWDSDEPPPVEHLRELIRQEKQPREPQSRPRGSAPRGLPGLERGG